MLSFTEENYIKALFLICQAEKGKLGVGTNELASYLEVKPATVNDMLKKLKEKGLIHYEKYAKVYLEEAGLQIAKSVVRKHRLWETFLFEKLGFSWDEVHEVAEQLEHIQSEKLVARLDQFLNFPSYDPHGDPIPNAAGELPQVFTTLLSELPLNKPGKIVGVKDSSPSFLKYLERLEIALGTEVILVEQISFDDSFELLVANNKQVHVSRKFVDSLLVR